MARLPEEHDAIYAAAARWKDECLINDGSIFRAGSLWTLPHIDELIVDFVERPDEGDRGFDEKLKDQLERSAPETKQLAAEMLWAMMLFPDNLKQRTKTELVRTVWEWSGVPLRDPDHLFDVFARGVGSGGMGYNNYRPFELFLMIRFAHALKSLAPAERVELLSDPWRFAEWFDRLPDATSRQLRHMLLHLLFPDDFERVSSKNDKKAIERTFGGLLSGVDLDARDRSATPFGRDRRLLRIRRILEAERPNQVVDFYSTRDLRGRWRPAEPEPEAGTDKSARVTESKQAPYSAGSAPATARRTSVWTIGTGVDAKLWPRFLDEGIIAIGWDELGDLRKYDTREQVKAAIKESYDRDRDPTNDALGCYQFCKEIRIGDEVFAKRGIDRILGHGIVRGEYEHDATRPDNRHVRRVEWLEQGNWTLPDPAHIPQKTLTDVTDHRAFREFMREHVGQGSASSEKPYTIDDAADEAFLDRSEIERMLQSLTRKKNLILQGSPGVGKTFLARRLAYALVGAEAPRYVQTIQFHQSYSYEDFIQGYRPNGSGGFTLKNGVFFEFCHQAQADPAVPHVFIIDEINRGNLSKVFGELMLLIEADKRGPQFAIPLTYAESPVDTFFVPENVYIIGLMNTADRSLALVDYALRRRFAFATLAPAFESPRFRAALSARGVDADVIDLIVTRVAEVNRRITADHKNLGPGFAVGHSYFCPVATISDSRAWFESVVRDEIEPLLDEYWFDDRARVQECLKLLTS